MTPGRRIKPKSFVKIAFRSFSLEANYSADSFCPGFPDDPEGVYRANPANDVGIVVAEIVSLVKEIPGNMVEEACVESRMTIRLAGEIEESIDGNVLEIAPSEIVLSGNMRSTGQTDASCPCEPTCDGQPCGSSDGCGGVCCVRCEEDEMDTETAAPPLTRPPRPLNRLTRPPRPSRSPRPTH